MHRTGTAADTRHRAIGAKSTNIEVTRKVTVEFTLAAAKAFAKLPRTEGRPFHFVFLSGFVVVRDQNASVWLFGEARKVAVCSPTLPISLSASLDILFSALEGGLESIYELR